MRTEAQIPLPGGHLSGAVALTGAPDCVVYVHGFGSDVRGDKPTAVFAACARRGWSCAAFEFRGHGRSSGTMRDLRASGLQSDLETVREWLESRGVNRTFLVGSSMGGFAASWYAADHADTVPAVALIAPAVRFLEGRLEALSEPERRAWRESGTIRYRGKWLDVELDYAMLEEQPRYQAEALAACWRTPALIFQGMQDETVPWRDTLELVTKTPFGGIELRLLGDGDHRLQKYAGEMAEESCRFFARCMGG